MDIKTAVKAVKKRTESTVIFIAAIPALIFSFLKGMTKKSNMKTYKSLAEKYWPYAVGGFVVLVLIIVVCSCANGKKCMKDKD